MSTQMPKAISNGEIKLNAKHVKMMCMFYLS